MKYIIYIYISKLRFKKIILFRSPTRNLNWSFFFQIEWNMIELWLFLLFLSQPEIRLVQNQTKKINSIIFRSIRRETETFYPRLEKNTFAVRETSGIMEEKIKCTPWTPQYDGLWWSDRLQGGTELGLHDAERRQSLGQWYEKN